MKRDMKEKGKKDAEGIGTLQEKTLHADLKNWCAQPGDGFEVKVDGYFIDIVRGEMLIEIQTRNFSALKPKLYRLVEKHPVRLVYPIPVEKWIVRQTEAGEPISRRKSPRRGRLEHIFLELIRIPDLIKEPNFSLQVVLARVEEIQVDDGQGSWRRAGRSIVDRRLIEALDTVLFNSPGDFSRLLPAGLPGAFTARELSQSLGLPIRLAQKMVYCLRSMGTINLAGIRDRAYLYQEAKL
jgi:hypothetical protein